MIKNFSKIRQTLLFSCMLALVLTSPANAKAPMKNFAIQAVPRESEPKKFARYLAFNEISKQGEAELVFLGDSITEAWESGGKEVWNKFYGDRKATNFGIGGDRTEHVLWRIKNGNFEGLHPKLIILMIGTNNTGHVGRTNIPKLGPEIGSAGYQCTAEQTAEGIALIVKKLREKMPDTDILLLGVFPRGAMKDDPMRLTNASINLLIQPLGDQPKVHFMDVSQKFLQEDGTITKEIMRDRLHLTPKGYEIWASAIESKIKELLANG